MKKRTRGKLSRQGKVTRQGRRVKPERPNRRARIWARRHVQK